MASYSETTAIALRRGNTQDNLSFTGVAGELVADMGETGDGTDINTTLRLHNGVMAGGIPMARSDFLNCTTAALAKNRAIVGDKNLAYADLSNFETLSDSTAIERIVNALDTYGLSTDEELEAMAITKANVTMSNIDTKVLAEAESGASGTHTGKNLAYYDMSNVNTKYLATTVTRSSDPADLPLAYYNQQNVDTTNLTKDVNARPNTMSGPVIAKKDLSNVENSTFNDIFYGNTRNFKLETTHNKLNVLTDETSSNDTYASAGAITNYVQDKCNAIEFLEQDFSNTENWKNLTQDENITSDIEFISELQTGGTGYQTGIHPIVLLNGVEDPKVDFKLLVNAVNANGRPTSVTLIPSFGITETLAHNSLTFKTRLGDSVTVSINLHAYNITPGATQPDFYGYEPTITSASVTNGGFTTAVYDATISEQVIPVMCIVVDSVNTNGAILTYHMAETNKPYMLSQKETCSIRHVNSETGTEGTITVDSKDIGSPIGGAGLLKKDMSNLSGMTSEDIVNTQNTSLFINPDLPMPSFKTALPSYEKGHIVTMGKLWEAMKERTTVVTIRTWD